MLQDAQLERDTFAKTLYDTEMPLRNDITEHSAVLCHGKLLRKKWAAAKVENCIVVAWKETVHNIYKHLLASTISFLKQKKNSIFQKVHVVNLQQTIFGIRHLFVEKRSEEYIFSWTFYESLKLMS